MKQQTFNIVTPTNDVRLKLHAEKWAWLSNCLINDPIWASWPELDLHSWNSLPVWQQKGESAMYIKVNFTFSLFSPSSLWKKLWKVYCGLYTKQLSLDCYEASCVTKPGFQHFQRTHLVCFSGSLCQVTCQRANSAAPRTNQSNGGKAHDSPYQRYRGKSVTHQIGVEGRRDSSLYWTSFCVSQMSLFFP